MSAIVDILTDIGEFFSKVVDFVVSLFEDLIYVIELIGQTVSNLPDYFAWLPTSIVTLLVALFAIVVIYKVLGRD